jgi:hypothetical protein
MNALLSTQAVAGFTIVQSASIYSFQYMYLGAMSAIGVGFTSARIAIGSDTLVLKGRGLDRLVELMTHRLLVKLYLVDKFEDISSDVRQSDNDFVWVSGFNIEVPQTQ